MQQEEDALGSSVDLDPSTLSQYTELRQISEEIKRIVNDINGLPVATATYAFGFFPVFWLLYRVLPATLNPLLWLTLLVDLMPIYYVGSLHAQISEKYNGAYEALSDSGRLQETEPFGPLVNVDVPPDSTNEARLLRMKELGEEKLKKAGLFIFEMTDQTTKSLIILIFLAVLRIKVINPITNKIFDTGLLYRPHENVWRCVLDLLGYRQARPKEGMALAIYALRHPDAHYTHSELESIIGDLKSLKETLATQRKYIRKATWIELIGTFLVCLYRGGLGLFAGMGYLLTSDKWIWVVGRAAVGTAATHVVEEGVDKYKTLKKPAWRKVIVKQLNDFFMLPLNRRWQHINPKDHPDSDYIELSLNKMKGLKYGDHYLKTKALNHEIAFVLAKCGIVLVERHKRKIIVRVDRPLSAKKCAEIRKFISARQQRYLALDAEWKKIIKQVDLLFGAINTDYVLTEQIRNNAAGMTYRNILIHIEKMNPALYDDFMNALAKCFGADKIKHERAGTAVSISIGHCKPLSATRFQSRLKALQQRFSAISQTNVSNRETGTSRSPQTEFQLVTRGRGRRRRQRRAKSASNVTPRVTTVPTPRAAVRHQWPSGRYDSTDPQSSVVKLDPRKFAPNCYAIFTAQLHDFKSGVHYNKAKSVCESGRLVRGEKGSQGLKAVNLVKIVKSPHGGFFASTLKAKILGKTGAGNLRVHAREEVDDDGNTLYVFGSNGVSYSKQHS